MIEYKQMDSTHIQGIAEIEKLCFSDPWSVNAITSELHNPLSYWLVALDGDKVVGYIGSQSVLGQGDMMNLAVDPHYRRQGIGLGLVNALIEKLGERSICSLTLEVRVTNKPAIALYESLGFVCVGRRPNYYTKPKEDALILRKEWSN